MARWTLLAVPAAAAVIIGAWWITDAVFPAPAPDLGPTIVITPRPGASGSPTTPPPSDANTVSPAPAPDAGDDDDDPDDDDSDDDDVDDTE